MFKRTLVASTSALLTVIVLAPQAVANCAMPVSYSAKVVGNTVTITPQNFGERGCPDSSGMLRENVNTGELVKLADYCSGTTAAGTATDTATSAAYVDECVPAGSYRYGYATPYACHGSSCSTDYFTAASVTNALASSCARSSGNAAPAAATTKPWTNVTAVCTYQSSNPVSTGGAPSTGAPGGGAPSAGGSNSIVAPSGGQNSLGGASTGGQSNSLGGSSTTTDNTASAGVDANPNQPGDSQSTPADSDSGCSIAAPTGTATVIGVNLATILVGLMLGRRRRSRNGTER